MSASSNKSTEIARGAPALPDAGTEVGIGNGGSERPNPGVWCQLDRPSPFETVGGRIGRGPASHALRQRMAGLSRTGLDEFSLPNNVK
jgi:hypothetical protein